MARKILNRRELREETEAAERLGAEQKPAPQEETSPAKKVARHKTRAKAAKEVRLKAFWGVFTQSLNPVVLFEYSQRKQADARAKELTESKKTPHFVQLVKKVIEP